MTAFTWDNFLQLTVNGWVHGTAYALLGVAFGLILGVTGRFHFAFTFTYAISAYLAATASTDWGIPFWPSLIIGAAFGAACGMVMEAFVYRPLALRAGAYALLTIFVASLGLAIIGTNSIALYWINEASLQISGFDNRGINIGPVTLATLDRDFMIVTWALIFLLAAVLRFTALGRVIRAVRVNPEMSLVIGVNPLSIYLVVFAIGGFLGGVAAVFDATKTAATPDMGFNPLFYAFTVAFLSGLSLRPLLVLAIGLGLGLIESWANLVLAPQWTQLVVFGILFVYVALRPVHLQALLNKVLAPVRHRQRAMAG